MKVAVKSAVFALLILGGVSAMPSARAADTPSAINTFGDSLSDVGNLYDLSGGTIPNADDYFEGRFSNGPVWVEYLAASYGLSVAPSRTGGDNYAFGGASTGQALLPPGINRQVSAFTATSPPASASALFVVWGGANDYLGGATLAATVVNNLASAISTLYADGARHFLVPNLADLGRAPSTMGTPEAAQLTALTLQHNALLASTLGLLSQANPGIETTLLDVYTLFEQAVANPSSFGFTNVTDACLDNLACTDPDQYLFWDGLHPTTAGHQFLADFAVAALVPEPVTTAGILLLGPLVAWRKLKSRRKAVSAPAPLLPRP